MAALFYTNHKMQDVTLFFYLWKERAEAIRAEKAEKAGGKRSASKRTGGSS
jgi:hypothetical protein